MTRLDRKATQRLTRERIKQSAELIFARNGVGAGIEQIVQAAGFTRGAFYANYRSKPELLIDIVADRQVREIRLWNEMFEEADDQRDCLDAVVAHTEDMVRTFERTMISIELQLEAERNPEFRPHFMAYLDTIYGEMRRLFTTILRRNGKAAPANLDAMVVIAYQFGLNLGSISILGSELGQRTTPGELMIQFLREMIGSAPLLQNANRQ